MCTTQQNIFWWFVIALLAVSVVGLINAYINLRKAQAERDKLEKNFY